MNISIIGVGYVGLVTGVSLAEIGNKVTCIDIDKKKIEQLNKGIPTIYEENLEELLKKNIDNKNIAFSTNFNDINESEIIFITVGTPENENGEANLSYVNSAIEKVMEYIKKDIIIIMKSTVPIGTNDLLERRFRSMNNDYKVDFVSNPEFLAQGTAIHDTFNASRIVIGLNNENIKSKINDLYAPFNQPVLFMNRTSAELVKYASNTFLALKISFINEIANLSDEIGADIKDVTKGMSYDDRIGKKFLNAGLGYGGSCFPKDTKALLKIAEKNNTELLTIKSTVDINEKQKYRLIKKLTDNGYKVKGKKIAILGLSFKPNTDDIREAPSLKNIEKLLELGAEISVFDPLVNGKVKTIFGDKIEYFNTPEEALDAADYSLIFTEWEEIKKLSPVTFTKNMKTPIIFDGRNCLDIKENTDIKYYGIGR